MSYKTRIGVVKNFLILCWYDYKNCKFEITFYFVVCLHAGLYLCECVCVCVCVCV